MVCSWRTPLQRLLGQVIHPRLCPSAARANEILSLEVEDLDLPNKRARGKVTEQLCQVLLEAVR